MIKSVQLQAEAFSPEVRAFADAQAVSAELPAVWQMTRRLFPSASIIVQLECDPEIPNDEHLVFVVLAPGLNSAEAVRCRREWHRGLFGCCPAPLAPAFRLGLELSP